MITFETADQKEVRRFRIAQFNGRTATVKSGGSLITGHVRSVLANEFEHPAKLDHHDHPDPAEGKDHRVASGTADAPVCGRFLLSSGGVA